MADSSRPQGGATSGQAGQPEKKAETGGSRGVVETVTEKAKDVASAVGDAAGQAREKVQEWAATATEKTKEATAAAGSYAVQAKDKVQEWSTTAADSAGDALESVSKELTALVRRYPLQALLVSAAVGYVLGRATTRS
jgi:ElaB/YqjD/DUF883 family membrane-anchored ribosome-binding protein